MITTGRPDSSATKTEVVDVVNGESCADLADFPLENCGAVGANLHGTPVVCGGSYSSDHSPMLLLEMLHLQQQLTCTMHSPPLTQQCHSCLEDGQVPTLTLP